MNGANPNINNDNSNTNSFGATTLNTTTLGTVSNVVNPQVSTGTAVPNPTPMPNVTPNVGESINTPTPMPNVTPNVDVTPTPINNVNNINQTVAPSNEVGPTVSAPTPIAQPIPGTESQAGINNLTGNTVGAGNFNFMGQNPTKPTNIGTVPPANTTTKKKPMNKIIFIIFIIVLMVGVAFGVYYFLNKSNSVKLTTKELTIGIGDIVPDDVKSYTSSISGNSSVCSVDNKNVDTTTIGEYKVTIKCKNKTYETKVIVADKEAPKVELSAVFRTVGTSVNVEDFVKSCTDPSNCKTSFKNQDEVNKYLETAGGPYKVEILAEDDNKNQATFTAELYVTSEDVFLYLDCSSSESEVLNYNVKKVTEDIFPIARTDFAFLNVARRDYVYTFSSEDEYKQVTGNKDNTITFDNVTGLAIYDDENKVLTISTDLSIDQLNSENNGTFPTNYSDILNLYQQKGYPGTQILNDYPKTEKSE